MFGRSCSVKVERCARGRTVEFGGFSSLFRSAPWMLGLALALTCGEARAAEPTAEDRTTARQLALEGYDALRSKDYALASDRFKRANALVHAPTLLLDLGRAYLGLGQLVNAHEAFQQIIREGVPPNAPPAWRKALASARKEVIAVEPRLAWVTIHVKGVDAARIELDGELLSTASLGIRRAVDPGHRTVTAEAEGFLPATSSVNLAEGQAGELELVLEHDPSFARHARAAAAPPPPRLLVVTPPPAPERTPAYVAFSVSGAGFLLSGVTTALMLKERSNLESKCQARQCTPELEGDVSSYRTYGTLAAVGLGVGLAGVGVGTYFWLSSSPSSDRRRAAVTPVLTPGYVGVDGRF